MATLALEAPPVNPAFEANPRDSWPAWTDELRWTLADADSPRPTAGPDFSPSEVDEAEAAGYELGYEHDLAAAPPAGWGDALKLRWWNGRNRGYLARAREDAEYDRMYAERLEDAFGDPVDLVHEAERCGVC